MGSAHAFKLKPTHGSRRLSVSKLRTSNLTQFKAINKEDIFSIIQRSPEVSITDSDVGSLKDRIASLTATVINYLKKVDELHDLKAEVACIPELKKGI